MSFTKEELELIEVLKKYGSRKGLASLTYPLYNRLLKARRDILDAALPSLKKTWTKEACAIEALKYDTLIAWQKGSTPSYRAALRNDWVGELSAHMQSLRVLWTKEACAIEALKFNSREDWKRGSRNSYASASRRGWTDELCLHMKKLKKSWTKQLCKEEALKYKTRLIWQTNSKGSYLAAIKHKWLEYCCSHMKKHIGIKPIYCFETKTIYKSLKEASQELNISHGNIPQQIKGKRSHVGGYTFKYVD